MSDDDHPLYRLVHELRKRRVIRAAVTYWIGAWVVLEGSSVVLPAFGAPDWALRYLVIASVAGFGVVAVLGWLYDLTPEGLVRAPEPGRPTSAPRASDDHLPARKSALPWVLSLVGVGLAVGVALALWIPGWSGQFGGDELPPVSLGPSTAELAPFVATGDWDGLAAWVEGAPPGPLVDLANGHLAFARMDRPAGLAAYAEALTAAPELAGDEPLVRNVVGSLGWTSQAARSLLLAHPSPIVLESLSARAGLPGSIGRAHAVAILEELGESDRVDPVPLALADLAEGKSCEERRDAVLRLGEHADPRALAPLQKLVRGGVARWFRDRCLRDDARAAIAAIEVAQPEGA